MRGRRWLWRLLVATLMVSAAMGAHKEQNHFHNAKVMKAVGDPARPVTPNQFTSVVVIGLNPNSVANNLSITSATARHWATLHALQLKSGLPSHSAMLGPTLQRFAGAGDYDGWPFLAGQYYYNSVSQKIRIDSTVPAGFLSTYAYYGFGSEWIYTFLNSANTSCEKYSLDKSSFPDVNWLQNAQFMGTQTVLGIDTYHWHGKGNHLGPNVGPNVYDYYVAVNDSSPILISNAGFAQYFVTFTTMNITQQLWNTPAQCAVS